MILQASWLQMPQKNNGLLPCPLEGFLQLTTEGLKRSMRVGLFPDRRLHTLLTQASHKHTTLTANAHFCRQWQSAILTPEVTALPS